MIIGIIADDLTGAADSAAPFALRGLQASAYWHHRDEREEEYSQVDACACSTGTRDISPDHESTIRQRVRDTVLRFARLSPRLLYKKIDSTLKGHLRLELDALRMELPGRLAVVCPAFPSNGRIVRGGRLIVHGQPGPAVRAAFAMEDDPLAVDLFLDDLRESGSRLAERLDLLRTRGAHTVFCDTESDRDLDLLAGALADMQRSGLGVGAAGLTAAIARTVSPDCAHAGGQSSAGSQLKTGRVLVVLGSMNPVSRRQARYLVERLGAEPVIYSPVAHDMEAQQQIVKQFAEGRRVVVAQSPDIRCSGPSLHALRFVAAAAGAVPGLGLLLTGGETAVAALSSLHGSGHIEVEGEAEPGLVTGRFRAARPVERGVDGVPVLLKAGGFGDAAGLARCLGME